MTINVGYYDMAFGSGQPFHIAPITTAGDTAINVATPDAVTLASLNMLFVTNQSNDGYGAEYLGNLAAIQAAVAAGMVLVIHDRYVDDAESILPGGAGFNIVRNFNDSTNIELLNDGHPIAAGPGGIVSDTSLDNGNSSSHGFTFAAGLPAGVDLILSTGDASHIVTFGYQYGAGYVVYSSIPLDHYLLGNGGATLNASMAAYATNLIDYLESKAAGINAAPTDITLSSTLTSDHRPEGALVGLLGGTDPDGDTLTYTILDDPHGRFQIDGNRLEIGAGGAPGGEFSLGYIYESSISLTIRATDGSGAYFDETFTIQVRPPSGVDGRGYFNRTLYDTRDENDWSSYSIWYDGNGISSPIAEKLLVGDDGSTVRTLYDTGNATQDLNYTTYTDANGFIFDQFGTFDDGRSWRTLNDGGDGDARDLYDFKSYTTLYNASGEAYDQTGTYDDGRSWRTLTDADDLYDFKTYSTLYNARGEAYDQSGSYDDGRSWRTLTDTDDLYGFKTYSNDYDADGNLVRQQGVNDDGSYWTTLYDVAGIAPWSIYERVWDASGAVILDRTTPDPDLIQI